MAKRWVESQRQDCDFALRDWTASWFRLGSTLVQVERGHRRDKALSWLSLRLAMHFLKNNAGQRGKQRIECTIESTRRAWPVFVQSRRSEIHLHLRTVSQLSSISSFLIQGDKVVSRFRTEAHRLSSYELHLEKKAARTYARKMQA